MALFTDRYCNKLYAYLNDYVDRLPQEKRRLFQRIKLNRTTHPKQAGTGDWLKITFTYHMDRPVTETHYVGKSGNQFYYVIETTGEHIISMPSMGKTLSSKHWFTKHADPFHILDIVLENMDSLFVRRQEYPLEFINEPIPARDQRPVKASTLHNGLWRKRFLNVFQCTPILLAISGFLLLQAYAVLIVFAGLALVALFVFIAAAVESKTKELVLFYTPLFDGTDLVYLKRGTLLLMMGTCFLSFIFFLTTLSVAMLG